MSNNSTSSSSSNSTTPSHSPSHSTHTDKTEKTEKDKTDEKKEKEDGPPPTGDVNSIEKPIKAGLLTKQGKSHKSWKKRLFLLTEKYLYYFVSSEDKGPRGIISIKGSTIQQEVALGKERRTHCFSVKAPHSWNLKLNKTFHERTYFFCTDVPTEMNDWMAIMKSLSK